ncbi:MAG: thioesterase family protein [Lentimicrobiaceae bacterium]|nr:thioesterase family protein [Lentimicrobiaceae bacterium]
MEFPLNPGISGHQEITVTSQDTASTYGSGLIEVFATPAMVALMEKTAQLSIQDLLPEGFISLGTEINVTHQKATPVGMKVVCESVLEKVEGKRLLFSVTARDEKGLIGRGTHQRYIVEAGRFMQKLMENT